MATMYYGTRDVGSTVYVYFSTHATAGGNVAPSSAFGNTDVRVYKNGSNAQSTTGVTVTSPFDSLVGFHLATIDTSADGTFYATANFFTVVLAPASATVDGQTITGVPIAAFDLGTIPTLATMADAVCDEALAGHTTAGTVGKGLSDLLTGVNVSKINNTTINGDGSATPFGP